MSDFKKFQYIFGTSDTAGAVLTTAFTDNRSQWINVADIYQFGFDIGYKNNGSGNVLTWQIDFSNTVDGSTLPTTAYQSTSVSTSSGVSTYSLGTGQFTAVASSGNFDYFHVLAIPNDSQWIRISAKETVNAGSAGNVVVKLTQSIRAGN